MDNAGSFDTLIPLLSRHLSFLAIDLPGHGLSSHLPSGLYYNSNESIFLLKILMQHYGWEKISLMGHSMGSIINFAFAAMYPDKIDLAACFDLMKPPQSDVSSQIDAARVIMDGFLEQNNRNNSGEEPKSYTMEDILERVHVGSFNSIEKKCCPHLLARNAQRSSLDSEKFFFTRDRRLKHYNYESTSQELVNEMAKRITCPYLFIKSSESSCFEDEELYEETKTCLKENPLFQYVVAEGTHHLLVNNPEKVCEVINSFICKYRPQDIPTSRL
ncbi:hypothetical protein ACFFRR_010321 [Megaselia abdita]